MVKKSLYAFACVTAFASMASADALLVGFNTQTPLQVYSSSGAYEQDFGPTGASAGVEENGLIYVAQPNTSGATTTVISALNSAQQVVSSFTFPSLISDGAPGPNGTLWLSGYDGMVYNVSTTGTVLSSFNTGYTNIGIASNGSTLYTTEGNSSDGIDTRNASGAVLSTVHTGLTSLYGIAYDSANSSLFAGTFNYVYDLSLTAGSIITTLNLPGASPAYPTPNGANHDGLELVDLSSLQSPPPPPTVPEPRLGWITGLLMALFLGGRWLRGRVVSKFKLAPALLLATNAFGSVNVTLTPTATSVPVGASITFTANASDTSNPGATFTYQFRVAPSGGSYSVVKDYYKINTLTWADTTAEGVYDVEVNVQSSTGASGFAIEPVTFTLRATGTSPVVNPTQNPLVALYSAPVCSAGKTIRVRFRAPSATSWQATPFQTCNGSTSMNFLIAGMLANTTYTMQQDLYNGPFDTPGPALTFTTGSIPSNVLSAIPSKSTLAGPTAPTSISYPFVLEARGAYPFTNDLYGNVVWYLGAMNNPAESGYVVRNTNAGTVLVIMDDPTKPGPTANNEFLREYDLAGNLVRETNWSILHQTINNLRAMKGKSTANVTWFSHEAFRMSNGYTAVIMTDERDNVTAQPNADVLGDIIVVLDTNWQPVWTWDAFDYLPNGRTALLNDTCSGAGGCPPLTNKMPNGQVYTIANDWTHMNSVVLDPSDGNLIASVRNQSWIVKVAYQNGAGDGHLVWTFGNQASLTGSPSFALPNGTPIAGPNDAWFSYQHCAQIYPNGQLTLFDNGDYRVSLYGGNNRGQSWSLNTSTMVATPIVNYDLGVYSLAVGYSALLSNGNYDFSSGFLNTATETQTFECLPGGSTSSCLAGSSGLAYKEQVQSFTYRAIRLPDMYTQR